jgi:hypothetical protein
MNDWAVQLFAAKPESRTMVFKALALDRRHAPNAPAMPRLVTGHKR